MPYKSPEQLREMRSNARARLEVRLKVLEATNEAEEEIRRRRAEDPTYEFEGGSGSLERLLRNEKPQKQLAEEKPRALKPR
jgi:hypothetical protein